MGKRAAKDGCHGDEEGDEEGGTKAAKHGCYRDKEGTKGPSAGG